MSDDWDAAARSRFEQVMLPHLDAAYTLARYLTRDEHDAEDVVQDAYLRALRHFAGYRGGDARAWLLTIVRNTFYTRRSRERGAPELESFDEELHSEGASQDDPERATLRRATAESLEAAVRALPPEFREVIVLRELQDLSYKTIAEMTGVPVGTVMSRLSRARQRLQRALGATLREAR
jgi:RNA polymerase sigma-70 factor (ECF subfamily)